MSSLVTIRRRLHILVCFIKSYSAHTLVVYLWYDLFYFLNLWTDLWRGEIIFVVSFKFSSQWSLSYLFEFSLILFNKFTTFSVNRLLISSITQLFHLSTVSFALYLPVSLVTDIWLWLDGGSFYSWTETIIFCTTVMSSLFACALIYHVNL